MHQQCKANSHVRTSQDLHVFRMVPYAVDHFDRFQNSSANPVNSSEQRKSARIQKEGRTFSINNNDKNKLKKSTLTFPPFPYS